MRISTACLLPVLFLLVACQLAQESLTSPQTERSSAILAEQGYQLLVRQQPKAALAIFDQALAGDPEQPRAHEGRAIALDQLGQHEAAEAAYQAALKHAPDAVQFQNNLAMSHIIQGRYEEAIARLTPLVTRLPKHEMLRANLALAHCLNNDRKQAERLYKTYLSPEEIRDNLRFCSEYRKRKS